MYSGEKKRKKFVRVVRLVRLLMIPMKNPKNPAELTAAKKKCDMCTQARSEKKFMPALITNAVTIQKVPKNAAK